MLGRLKQRLLAVGRALGKRFPFLETAWRVQRRFGELNGSYLASAVTLSSFLSLFPLVLVGIAILGFFSAGDPTLGRDVLRVLGIPASSDAATVVTEAIETAEQSKAAASIVGVVGLLWTGLGLVAALQYVYDAAWQVTGRGLKDKLFGLLWLVGAAVLFVSTFAVTSLINALPGFLAPINLVVGIALSFTLFLWTSKVLPHRDIGWAPLIPGAIVGAVGLEVLKVVGGVYVPKAVASSSAMYGSLGIVFAILAWLLFFGKLVVYSAVTNVVRWEEEHGSAVVDIRVPNLPGEEDAVASRSGQQNPGEAAMARP